ncbi:glycosyltransferase family 61 protein [Paenibacillus beijingensis]|uniref:glycosyltransferase family 61 protein n=1 Tax=Paenibacillus beijingensis TaxID=1126833 RepID=UPI000697EBED|nr:glycosyltransferase family 61 protein [Paenibacillus beijingensis]
MGVDGYYVRTLDWAIETGVANHYKEIYPEHTMRLLKPKSVEPLHQAFTYNDLGNFPPSFAALIPNGRLWGQHAAVITPNNKLLNDVSLEWQSVVDPQRHPVFQQGQLPPATYTGGTVAALAFVGAQSYYHWFVDVLPRIHLLRESGVYVDKYVINTHLPFQYETLAKMGITRDKIIETTGNHNFHLQAEKLIVTSIPNHLRYPKWVVNFIRGEFFENHPIQTSSEFERIYVSRDDANYRKVVNEDEVMNVLAGYGFRKVVLSHLSLDEKRNIFASAKYVVSALGSGLIHLLFCSPKTKVIEFLPPNFVDICFWRMSNFLKLDYYYLMAEGAGFHGVPNFNEMMEMGALGVVENLAVDIHKFTRLLERAGL